MLLSRKSWPKILPSPPFDGRHLPLRQLFPCQRRPPPAFACLKAGSPPPLYNGDLLCCEAVKPVDESIDQPVCRR